MAILENGAVKHFHRVPSSSLAACGAIGYHSRVMVKPAPSRFNPDIMARDGTRYEAELPLRQFPRLHALLADTNGSVHAGFRFSRRKDHIVVSGHVEARFPLVCQRCLEPMVSTIDEPFEFVFVADEAEAKGLPDELDPVILDETGQIHMVDLLEDELILNLPTVPKHASSKDCGRLARELEAAEVAAEEQRAEKVSPFGVLKDLKLH